MFTFQVQGNTCHTLLLLINIYIYFLPFFPSLVWISLLSCTAFLSCTFQHLCMPLIGPELVNKILYSWNIDSYMFSDGAIAFLEKMAKELDLPYKLVEVGNLHTVLMHNQLHVP